MKEPTQGRNHSAALGVTTVIALLMYDIICVLTEKIADIHTNTYEVGCQIAGHHAQIVKPEDDILLEKVEGWYECQHEEVCQCHVE